jgi:hypothetical protein
VLGLPKAQTLLVWRISLGLAHLAVLAFQGLDAVAVLGCRPRPQALITFS